MPTYSDDVWDQFEVVYKRVSDGKEFCKKATQFLSHLAKIEKSYAQQLMSLCKATETDFGTVTTGWTCMKDQLCVISEKHKEISDIIQTQAADQIQNWLTENKKPRIQHREQARKLLRDLSAAEKNCQSAKKTYEESRKKQDEYKDAYEKETYSSANSKNAEKLSKQLKQQTIRADQADTKYRGAVDVLDKVQLRYYKDEMPMLLSKFQEMEESRISLMRQTLTTGVKSYQDVIPAVTSALQTAQASVSAIDQAADIEAFCNEKTTRTTKPPRVQYEPYSSAQGRCVPDGGSGGGGGGGVSASSVSQPAAAVASMGRSGPVSSGPATSGSTSHRGATPVAAAPAAAASPAPAMGGGGGGGGFGDQPGGSRDGEEGMRVDLARVSPPPLEVCARGASEEPGRGLAGDTRA
mmetsp:Transcript_34525/g.86729  ORF Transcript_34525/g.86729 Transcript_34525/m.86729 type:complete len:409 (+) Transcript_34525:115-1341(+)